MIRSQALRLLLSNSRNRYPLGALEAVWLRQGKWQASCTTLPGDHTEDRASAPGLVQPHALSSMCLAVSEERGGGGNALQIVVRDRVDEGDTEFVSDKPVRLLQMVRTVTQNDREQFEDSHFAAVMGRDHPVKGGLVIALQEGDDLPPDAITICRHCCGRFDLVQSRIRSPHVLRAHTAVLMAEPGQLGK